MSFPNHNDRHAWTTRLLNADNDLAEDLSVSPPLHQSVNYAVLSEEHLDEISGPLGSHYYTRRGNPTGARLAKVVADLEGAETGMVFASGMGAIATTLMAFLKSGDHVVGQKNHYIGITEMIDRILPDYGVEQSRVDQRSVDAFAAAIRPNTKLIVLESPSNPLMHVTDLKAVCDIARARGIVTLCDNTLATPINQRPIELGVDIVMHSVTKYIGGHHDLLAGCIVSSRPLVEKVWNLSMVTGAIAAPFNSWLALRGIRTLELRVRQQNRNALAIAERLEHHPAVLKVFYPGLPTHAQHRLAAEQMSGFGGLLTFDLKGGYGAGQSFIQKLRLARHASSLGGVSSTLVQPATLFGGRLPSKLVEEQGITPGLIRFAAGIENTEDLVADIEQALG
ncbi:MAG: aminotransferase class I/II-fold pyridoxal phosphate-dependent enzyme [Alphaproteobacteria bacterium]|nr:aminotransferase class I/II-fold pyridoxal phosphate-dependent enzyme [Alphaproteobacteria bacterium]